MYVNTLSEFGGDPHQGGRKRGIVADVSIQEE